MRRLMLAVISGAILVVLISVPLIFFSKPEFTVKRDIETLAKDYYENYFYPQLLNSADKDLSLDEIFSKYVTAGFATMSLRQILLFDNTKATNSHDTITKYCNENNTFIQIYPEPPFQKNNYRIDYHYSCDFE